MSYSKRNDSCQTTTFTLKISWNCFLCVSIAAKRRKKKLSTFIFNFRATVRSNIRPLHTALNCSLPPCSRCYAINQTLACTLERVMSCRVKLPHSRIWRALIAEVVPHMCAFSGYQQLINTDIMAWMVGGMTLLCVGSWHATATNIPIEYIGIWP